MGRTPAVAAAVVLALWACHMSAVAEAKFEIQQDAVSGERRVVATADHEAETIECWPCVPKASRVYERSTRADKVAVQVYVKRVQQAMTPMIFYIRPEFEAPADTTRADVLDRDVRLRTWQWDATETMHVFWVARNATHDAAQADSVRPPRENMELREKDVLVCMPGASGIVLAIKLPVLVNVEAVKKGGELARGATVRLNAHGKTNTPKKTWRTDEAREAKEKENAAGQPAPKKAKKAFD